MRAVATAQDEGHGKSSSSSSSSSPAACTAWLADLRQTPARVRRRALRTKTLQEMQESAAFESKHQLARVLGLPLLTLICLGQIIGSGIFVLTGVAAAKAGPAVIVSYLVSGIIAMLSAMTFVELAVDFPLAGSSFNYTLAVLGEFPAWLTVTAICFDGLLAGGTVARSWSSYVAVVFGKSPNFFLFHAGGTNIDPVAFGITLVITAIVAYGTSEAAWVNFALKGTNIVLIVLVLCCALPKAHVANWHDFFPFKDAGVFAAAALVFFAFNGYNAACNVAEEAKRPQRDLPIAILASLSLATVLYLLMCMAITLMVPYQHITLGAPFAAAFQGIPGYAWAAKAWAASAHLWLLAFVIGVGAVLGLGTVLLVQVLVISREFLVMARHNLIPPWFARVNAWTGTPLRITLAFGSIKALFALLIDLDVLASLVNCGILFTVCMVATSVLIRRYFSRGRARPFWPVGVRVALLLALSICFAACYRTHVHYGWLLALAVLSIAAASSFWALAEVYKPPHFRMPLVPLTTGLTLFGAIFLIASLPVEAIWRFAACLAGFSALYLLYGVHAAERHDAALEAWRAAQMKLDVEQGAGGGSSHELGLAGASQGERESPSQHQETFKPPLGKAGSEESTQQSGTLPRDESAKPSATLPRRTGNDENAQQASLSRSRHRTGAPV